MNASSRIRIRPLATTCRMFILAVFVAAFPASAISLVHVFAPAGYAPLGELCADGSGFLYGATANGGPWGGGILFRVRTDGTDYTILHEFGPGFDGASPRALVFDGSATLYGTTYRGGASGNGTVYRVGLDGGGYSVLHSFAGAPSGFFPNGPVVLSGGNLYGTTERGGSSDLGTLFSCNAVSGTVSILHSFTGGA